MIYEQLVLKTNTHVFSEINIKKEKDDLLGFNFTNKSVKITDDGRIIFPTLMVMKITPNGVAEKHGFRLGSQILKINDRDVSLENYNELLKNENLKIKINTSYCMIYQLMLREGFKFNFSILI